MTAASFAPFPWTPLSIADALKPRPPTRYIIDGLFEAASLNMLYGAPGALKSLLLLDACACVVAGVPWLTPGPGSSGGRSFKTTKDGALYLDFDNGRRRALDRLEAVARHRGLKAASSLRVVAMPVPWLDLTKIGDAQALIGFIQQQAAALVVLDNLGVICGDADENSADMAGVMAVLRYAVEVTGAAVILVHHQRKGAVNGKQRAGDSLRGHSSIEAALDLALRVERDPDDPDLLNIEATKARGVEVPAFGARFAYRHKPGTHDLETLCFFGEAPAKVSLDQQAKNAILDVLVTKGTLNQGTLVTAVQSHLGNCKVGRDRILRNLAALVGRGLVVEQIGFANNAKSYSSALP